MLKETEETIVLCDIFTISSILIGGGATPPPPRLRQWWHDSTRAYGRIRSYLVVNRFLNFRVDFFTFFELNTACSLFNQSSRDNIATKRLIVELNLMISVRVEPHHLINVTLVRTKL